MRRRANAHSLLHAVLKSVSRSFFLTLKVVPADVRDQVGLAYLLARAADTIADTDLIERDRRLHYLARFRVWIMEPTRERDVVQEIQTALLGSSSRSGERVLLERLEDCRGVLEAFSPEDQGLVRGVLATLTQGMVKDLTVFPGSTAQTLTALKSLEELDRYTYDVAGCVGDFWTRMMCAHRRALHGWDVEAMATVGIQFGKGLQLTNVLRDTATDLRRGRCYIPEELLAEAGLTPRDLLDPGALPKFRPVLTRLLRIAVDHLDQGWLYTMAIPRQELRLRLACVWPILFAVKTLQRVSVSPDLLNPDVTLKVTRGEIYRIMVLTGGVFGCGRALTAYYGHLRKGVAC
ncbi:MAG TPA: phytoene/squalene synthase family protein [Nitrospirales bacterium]|nr:phytoene/squalene synthase family protein [Nitrospirales bacterium]